MKLDPPEGRWTEPAQGLRTAMRFNEKVMLVAQICSNVLFPSALKPFQIPAIVGNWYLVLNLRSKRIYDIFVCATDCAVRTYKKRL